MSDDLRIAVDDGVMLATLNRPDVMNAMSKSVVEGLIAAVDDASRRDDVHALVVTGEGRGFCAGAEVGTDDSIANLDTDSRFERIDRRGLSGRFVLAFADSDVPIIAAVNGPAVGAGFGLALSCDVRFLADSARVGPIFIRRGLAADFGASYWLPRIVGIARAYEIFYEGDLLDAERCLDLGLANRVVPADRLLEEALDYGRRIAQGPPLGYTSVRRMLLRSGELPMANFLEYEWSAQRELLASEDSAEGFAAFAERRDPVFKGR